MARGLALTIGLNSVDPKHYGGWSGELDACEADAEDVADIASSKKFKLKTLLTKTATRAKELKDLSLKKEIPEQRPCLKPLIEQKGFEVTSVFQMVECASIVWTVKTNFLPKEYIRLEIGKKVPERMKRIASTYYVSCTELPKGI